MLIHDVKTISKFRVRSIKSSMVLAVIIFSDLRDKIMEASGNQPRMHDLRTISPGFALE
jgi:hypothetical protein